MNNLTKKVVSVLLSILMLCSAMTIRITAEDVEENTNNIPQQNENLKENDTNIPDEYKDDEKDIILNNVQQDVQQNEKTENVENNDTNSNSSDEVIVEDKKDEETVKQQQVVENNKLQLNAVPPVQTNDVTPLENENPTNDDQSEKEKLQTPSNLHWRYGSVDLMMEWDPIQKLETPEEDRIVEAYVATIYYGENSVSANSATVYEEYTKYDAAIKVADFVAEHGEGYYCFTVKALAKEGSNYTDSDIALSDVSKFSKITVEIETLDENGNPSEEEGGSVGLTNSTGGGGDASGKTYLYPNEKLTLNASNEKGYVFDSIKFDNEPADLSINGKSAVFTLDKTCTATVTFKKNTEKVDVYIEAGEKHKEFASKIKQQMGDGVVLEGSKLKLNWPLADNAASVDEYYQEALAEILGGKVPGTPSMEDYIDNGERLNDMLKLATKTAKEYSDYSEYMFEDLSEVDIKDNLTLYVLWDAPATEGSYTLEPLVCGTEIKIVDGEQPYYPKNQDPSPDVKAVEGSQLTHSYTDFHNSAKWLKTEAYDAPVSTWTSGTVIGGDVVYARFIPQAEMGYFVDKDNLPAVTVNGENAEVGLYKTSEGPYEAYVVAVMYKTVVEHDWDEGEVKKEPTFEEDGVRTYTCKHCDETKAEVIPKYKWVFDKIEWSDDYSSAKALYYCEGNDELKESIDCEVVETINKKKEEQVATVSAQDSLDKQEHSDTHTVYAVWNLYIQGKHITGEICDDILGDGKVSYDPDTNTITLNNATIEATKRAYGSSGDHNEYGIRARTAHADEDIPEASAVEGPLTIKLIGTNTITNKEYDSGTADVYGLAVPSGYIPVKFTGGGTLNVAFKADDTARKYYGIETRNNTTVEGVTINVDISGEAETVGYNFHHSGTVSLEKSAKLHISTGSKGYAFDSVGTNHGTNIDLSVSDGCIFEASSGNKAINSFKVSDSTKALGALVNEDNSMDGSEELNKVPEDLSSYRYIRIPLVKAEYTDIEGDGNVWYKGSNEESEFIFKRTLNDFKTFESFKGIEVDGKPVGKDNYTADKGSVIIKLKPSYLETLSVGQHRLRAIFEDGHADVVFTIKRKPATKRYVAPRTGD